MGTKKKNEFTKEERNWMDAIAINYVIAQSDGYQLGYAQAISDFTNNIIDYWEGTDDTVQQSVLDALVDLGVELGKRKVTAKKNVDVAKKHGYREYYGFRYKNPDDQPLFETNIPIIFTKGLQEKEEGQNR